MRLLARAVVVACCAMSVPATAQQAPCTAPATWFPHSQTPEQNAAAFPGNPNNCDFHQFSWNAFLWLTQDVKGQPRFLRFPGGRHRDQARHPQRADRPLAQGANARDRAAGRTRRHHGRSAGPGDLLLDPFEFDLRRFHQAERPARPGEAARVRPEHAVPGQHADAQGGLEGRGSRRGRFHLLYARRAGRAAHHAERQDRAFPQDQARKGGAGRLPHRRDRQRAPGDDLGHLRACAQRTRPAQAGGADGAGRGRVGQGLDLLPGEHAVPRLQHQFRRRRRAQAQREAADAEPGHAGLPHHSLRRRQREQCRQHQVDEQLGPFPAQGRVQQLFRGRRDLVQRDQRAEAELHVPARLVAGVPRPTRSRRC